ncbi:hypothetical protein BDY21DRAFT_344676 [Lineolata rhizophorae]|uniref:Uncharacterized protein n=1 Tax=Lineolata rhizophorae TaxID=578093 RepID=A0A6A6NZ52_9PEZI|nr:hypothetical protein BDY21DRAFT_344676 [Lineolata rhizophorae]
MTPEPGDEAAKMIEVIDLTGDSDEEEDKAKDKKNENIHDKTEETVHMKAEETETDDPAQVIDEPSTTAPEAEQPAQQTLVQAPQPLSTQGMKRKHSEEPESDQEHPTLKRKTKKLKAKATHDDTEMEIDEQPKVQEEPESEPEII